MQTLVPGKLTVLTNIPFEPMEYLNGDGKLAGFDIDLIQAIGKKLGIEVVIEQKDWDLMFELVKQHKVDLAISSISVTTERAQEFNFSIPYLEAGQVILIESSNSSNIFNASNLFGKKVVSQKNTTSAIVAKEAKADVRELDNNVGDQEVQELISHKIDAIILDYVAGVTLVKKYPNIKIVGSQLTEEYYAILFPLSEYNLTDAVNSILREMKQNGELDALKKRWLQ